MDTTSGAINMQAARPKRINDRLMPTIFSLIRKRFAKLISAYAATSTNLDELKDRFYEDLNDTMFDVPRADKLIILGDFNARAGRGHMSWEGVMGKHGVGKCNNNGLLLDSCATNGLLITSRDFPTAKRHQECTYVPNTGIYLTTLSLGKGRGGM